jgi:hypothetical protein
MDFLRSHLIMTAPLTVDHFRSSLLGGFAVDPAKSDDWKWSTDKGAFIIKWLLKKSILYISGIPQKVRRILFIRSWAVFIPIDGTNFGEFHKDYHKDYLLILPNT